jgi:hypothetical protein
VWWFGFLQVTLFLDSNRITTTPDAALLPITTLDGPNGQLTPISDVHDLATLHPISHRAIFLLLQPYALPRAVPYLAILLLLQPYALPRAVPCLAILLLRDNRNRNRYFATWRTDRVRFNAGQGNCTDRRGR